MPHYPSDPYHRGAANRDCEDEALGWVVRLSSGEATEGDRHEFERWSADDANAIAYGQARRLWHGLRAPLSALLDNEDLRERHMPLRRGTVAGGIDDDTGPAPLAKRRRWPRAMAVALLFGMVGGTTQYLYVGRFDYVSGPMTIARERLADGSIVTMTPGTAMTTVFDKGARHVALARGEAFFKVRHDAAHPFVVSAGYGVVRVLGTAFSVRRDTDGRVSVIVTEGRVEVKSGARMAVLIPDQAVSFSSGGIGRVKPVSADLETAWVHGRLVLQDQPLAKVVAEINRYSGRHVVLLNEEAGRRHVNAVVDLRHVDNWLVALSATQGLFRTSIGPINILR